MEWLKNEQRRSATREMLGKKTAPQKDHQITWCHSNATTQYPFLIVLLKSQFITFLPPLQRLCDATTPPQSKTSTPDQGNERSGYAPSDHFPLIAMVPETLFGLLQVWDCNARLPL
jgi:hypothetical protein